jgi:hypothetical protein
MPVNDYRSVQKMQRALADTEAGDRKGTYV